MILIIFGFRKKIYNTVNPRYVDTRWEVRFVSLYRICQYFHCNELSPEKKQSLIINIDQIVNISRIDCTAVIAKRIFFVVILTRNVQI